MSIENALEQLRLRKPIVIMDNENRENEGDLFVPAEYANPDTVNFFIRYTTGILCVPMTEARAEQLQLPRMVTNNEDPHATNFTITCDSIACGTGVSAKDRSFTIQGLADGNSTVQDFRRPGHIFPLIAANGCLAEREGHTEASVTLCKILGCNPVGLIAELTNDNGEMMRYADCTEFARKHGLIVITIEQIKQYLIKNPIPPLIGISRRSLAQCELTLETGDKWDFYCYGNYQNPHKVLIKGHLDVSKPVLTRVHSECYTGDCLGSALCDCGNQLTEAKNKITERGSGLIIILAGHEGRGIGLVNKIRAYNLIQKSNGTINTFEANIQLGFPEDVRNYTDAGKILADIRVKYIELLTSNPHKIKALESYIVKVTPLDCASNPHNRAYIESKKQRHLNI